MVADPLRADFVTSLLNVFEALAAVRAMARHLGEGVVGAPTQ